MPQRRRQRFRSFHLVQRERIRRRNYAVGLQRSLAHHVHVPDRLAGRNLPVGDRDVFYLGQESIENTKNAGLPYIVKTC